MKKVFIPFLLFILLLVGCSSKPDDVRKEMWDEGLKVYQDISTSIQNGSQVTDEQIQRVNFFYNKYTGDTSITDNEAMLLFNLNKLLQNAIEIKIAKLKMDHTGVDDGIKEFIKTSDSLKEIFKG
ncbi:hypothetical protein [Aneurinibacillus tyrosinisolvens]|uniref:hypothetical protein n=1 Tax=Aneurinibacillus tyrosinisolvens TaxID=1443435 RepID=UPI00128E4BA5|nr:hypothetical protein [Aneurinibacillus tyrosinisolvens]